ncbi:DUF4258 domain-containing protein [Lysobacter sp. LF1]|uniref:DUF4258 domain-containing protein n=1 Tax=Lysobacter stagni TaxID=3045172 RepID=A0ABT6XI73_9GAMM|nr:DUF4258 domain-containing protein [Lysobacter sp. LF1]MDI9239865.1 DUF4258 domain-containing protein [Lysobacter sp. LF1]
MPLIITEDVRKKIADDKHGNLTPEEVEQCFLNHDGRLCTDDREEHRTDPPTQWFVAETNHRRRLKIVFVRKGSNIHLKTAYPATDTINRLYCKYGS